MKFNLWATDKVKRIYISDPYWVDRYKVYLEPNGRNSTFIKIQRVDKDDHTPVPDFIDAGVCSRIDDFFDNLGVDGLLGKDFEYLVETLKSAEYLK